MVEDKYKGKWRVIVFSLDESICVKPEKGLTYEPFSVNRYSRFVYLNWIDKWRGISLKDKVKKEMKLCQNWCDKQNKKESMMNKICKEINKK